MRQHGGGGGGGGVWATAGGGGGSCVSGGPLDPGARVVDQGQACSSPPPDSRCRAHSLCRHAICESQRCRAHRATQPFKIGSSDTPMLLRVRPCFTRVGVGTMAAAALCPSAPAHRHLVQGLGHSRQTGGAVKLLVCRGLPWHATSPPLAPSGGRQSAMAAAPPLQCSPQVKLSELQQLQHPAQNAS